MRNDQQTRQYLLFSLNGDGAHTDFESAIREIPVETRGKRPAGAEHSPWEVLEHLRIAQWDILEYVRDPKHVSPEFPSGYWPEKQTPSDADAWEKSVQSFRDDFQSVIALVSNQSIDLLAPLHGDAEQSIARKLFMLADHNAYHLGEMVLLRRVLGCWK